MKNLVLLNELRIGNIISSRMRNRNIIVNWFTLRTISNGGKNTYSPIQLTDDVLIKIGFSKDSHNNYCYDMIYIDKKSNRIVIYITKNENWFEIPKEIIHLHELQNIYFILTGTELDCNILLK